MAGFYDIKDDNQSSPGSLKLVQFYEDLHIEMVKYSYKIVSEVFAKHESADLRESCLKNGTFERFIERLGHLSSEKKRVKVDRSFSVSDTSSPEKANELQKAEKKTQKDQNNKGARKGVGYTTSVGTTWNVSEYLKSKEAKSS